MTYHNATKYILNAPAEKAESIPGTSIKKLWNYLGNPQRNLKYLRLAGSNGKTVCVEMLTSSLKQTDLSFGCFTVPIRREIRENILICGNPLPFEEIALYTGTVYNAIQELKKQATPSNDGDQPPADDTWILTGHEILLTVALLAFKAHDCHLALIESDHQSADPSRFLPAPFAAAICGTIPSANRKEIQRIRSYICHGIQEIISAPQDKNAFRMISDTCASINCRLTIPAKSQIQIDRIALNGSDFSYKGTNYRLSLCGKFQITNAVVVLEILEALQRRGFSISDNQIRQGLQKTKIPSKFEILGISPVIIADSTHSEIAIPAVCESMADFRPKIGSKVRLILPEGTISDQYRFVLQEMDYEILDLLSIPLYSEKERPSPARVKYVRQSITQVLKSLAPNEILLISGPTPFTMEIRGELLKILGF